MQKEIFDTFFNPYAKTVDKAAGVSAFWRLSDEIITEIVRREIAPYCTDSSLTMDAGGGTGRWAIKLSEVLKGKFVIFDRSADMLAKASENIGKSNVSDRINMAEGDLIQIDYFADNSVDNIVSIYSPLSFIYEQGKAAKELFRILKPGGRILVMSHSYHNALASKINNYRADSKELQKLANEQRVKWAPHVPELVTHSKESIEKLFSDAGFQIQKTYGVPVFVQPGPEDFDSENEKKSAVSEYLENPDVFKSVFEIEMRFNANETVANRGMNMFMLAEKK
ncbi:MAG: methyltransferase domain-containing protein [bacterium]|nr:methyltransferase domain-containing protein [bacterium]